MTERSHPPAGHPDLRSTLAAYAVAWPDDAADVARALDVAKSTDPWDRSTSAHATGSAVVVHPPTGRVLLRWHDLMGSYLHVGGHGDPGERSPLDVARREATEETALRDLRPWPDGTTAPIHVIAVPVPANPTRGEGAHTHIDIRYVLATDEPDRARAEHETATVRWLPLDRAVAEAGVPNLRATLGRIATLL
ncbi:MAG: NUDIX domain-containing protein [Actinomycetota bacterium]|nr:NUDIX domain-containing protein [Actinomycetota bacterium]